MRYNSFMKTQMKTTIKPEDTQAFPIITALISHVTSECKAVDREAVFDEMLDELYSFEPVGGPFAYMQPSQVLKECDPTAYRCGVNDYFGTGDEWVEVENETYRRDEVEEAREAFVDDLKSRLSDLEGQFLAWSQDGDWPKLANLKRDIADLEAAIDACERYTF